MPEFAKRLEGIPLVSTTAQRGTEFPTPSVGQRVQNLETGRFERYTGSAWVSLPSIDSAVSVTDHGAIGDGQTSNAAVNVTAFRAAIVAAAAGKKNLYIPAGDYRVNNNMTFDGDCSGMTVFGDGPSSLIRLSTTLDGVANVEAGWTIILDGASNGALENFRLTGIRVDGNRSGISGFDSGNTCNLIVGYQDSSFHNVQVDNCTAHSALQGSGFLTYAAGIRFIDCQSYDNDYHGGACSRDTTFGDADKVVEWTNFTAHDNGQITPFDGCGLDVGRYCRSIVTNLNSYWNGQGMKFSIGTELLIVRGARLAYNLFNGFQDTDTVGTATLDLDGIVTHNNGGIGFRCVSGSNVRIGSVTSYSNYCRTGSITRSGNGFTGGTLAGADILFGEAGGTLLYVEADSLRTKSSPTGGILVDGSMRGYRIGYVEARECETFGFADNIGTITAWLTATAYVVGDVRVHNGVSYICTSAHTSGAGTEPGIGGSWETVWDVFAPSGIVESGMMVENNNAGTAASASACAIKAERTGSVSFRNITFLDNQATVTQHSAFSLNSGIQADIDGCHFGIGIAAGSEIYSATSGTRVRFGHNNTGTLVTRARGNASEAGGAGTVTVTYPTPISNLGGLVLFPMVYPTSADACEANYISATSRTALTLTCPTTFGGGAGAVTFRYDVQAEVQR